MRCAGASPANGPLVRDPSDTRAAIVARGASVPKSLLISLFASGLGKRLRALGFPTNHGFSGASPFNVDEPYEAELARFFKAPGSRHLVMCHPGYPDVELAALDPVVARRRQELDAIMSVPGLPEAIWHVERHADRMTPVWPGPEGML